MTTMRLCTIAASILAMSMAAPAFGRESSKPAQPAPTRPAPAAPVLIDQRIAPAGHGDWLSALVQAANTTCKSGDGDVCSCTGGCYATATVCKCL